MSLITYDELVDLCQSNVIEGVAPDRINAASIDVTLGDTLWVEASPNGLNTVVDLIQKETPAMDQIDLKKTGFYSLAPGQFCLAQTREVFHLPEGIVMETWYSPSISGEYKLKSSMARAGLGHLLAGWCFTGDTSVPLLDGTEAPIERLVGQENVWVYAVDSEGEFVPAQATDIRVTGYVTDLVEVLLDNGKSFRCTPEHRIMLRTGQYELAGNLTSDTSLMPLCRNSTVCGHEAVYSPSTYLKSNYRSFRGRFVETHRAVYEALHGVIPEGYAVHHIDHNPKNNTPANLELLSASEHIALHNSVRNRSLEARMRSSDHMKALNATLKDDPEHQAKLKRLSSLRMAELNAAQWKDKEHRDAMRPIQKLTAEKNFSSVPKETVQRAAKLGMVRAALGKILSLGLPVSEETYTSHKRQNAPTVQTLTEVFGGFDAAVVEAGYKNHKVVSVTPIHSPVAVPVYDMTVPKYSNFALSVGVYVHNCDPGWNNSVLTLEFVNHLKYHSLTLRPGMRCGQIVLWRGDPVPNHASYATKGRYNNDRAATPSKGVGE
jgi:deoxycytidine triphosphate deaminase